MKNVLISLGIYVVVGSILGIVISFIIPEIAGWQTGLIIGLTIVLFSAGSRLDLFIKRKIAEKNKNKENA